jgi:RNA polymerase sigma-70 factor (ECF subfamily)
MPHAAPPTDQALLERARAGDQRAFQSLVERYEGKVAATVIGMLGHTPEADDVGQETFIRLYQSLDKFRGEASLGTYVTRIAINQSLKALKRRQTWRQRFLSRDAAETPLAEPAVPAGQQVDARERAALVHAALQRLTPEHRAVVVLRMLEGYSTNGTADLLGIPPGTVMSRLSRGLDKLEHLLGPVLGPAPLADDDAA